MTRVPAPDAMIAQVFSELPPMTQSGFLSVYGGLVPLGYVRNALPIP